MTGNNHNHKNRASLVETCEPTPLNGHECPPAAALPAWWSGFMFHVLNPRQVCMFLYLTMLSQDSGECHPTIEQIRDDLGLYSASMVFEALAALEELGFFTRERQSFPGVRAKRNVYRRTACELTMLRLLERNLIDGYMRPMRNGDVPAAEESKQLVGEGLKSILSRHYTRYAATPDAEKRDVLVEILSTILRERASED